MTAFFSFKNKNKPSSVGAADFLHYDTDSDTLTEISHESSSTFSLDRSSTSTNISWAEDSIRQNLEEWEKIERIFYGEEDLPSEPKTREEFLQWMTAFPHLRIKGESIKFDFDPSSVADVEHVDEIIAIDPIPAASGLNNLKSKFKYEQKKTTDTGKTEIDSVGEDLDNFLRITSGPLRRNNRMIPDLFRNNSQKYIIMENPNDRNSNVLSSRFISIREPIKSFDVLSASSKSCLSTARKPCTATGSRSSIFESIRPRILKNNIMSKRLTPLNNAHTTTSATNNRITPSFNRDLNAVETNEMKNKDPQHIKSATTSAQYIFPKAMKSLPAINAKTSNLAHSFNTEVVGHSYSGTGRRK